MGAATQELVKELRIEAGLNELCGSLEFTDLLRRAANTIEVMEVELTSWRYSHGEIEAACGGAPAMFIREKVLERRHWIEADNAGQGDK
jgi:hypothetical protein